MATPSPQEQSKVWHKLVVAAVRATYSHIKGSDEGKYPDTGVWLPEGLEPEQTEDYLVFTTAFGAFVMLTDMLLPRLRLNEPTLAQTVVLGQRWQGYLDVVLALYLRLDSVLTTGFLALPTQVHFPVQDMRLFITGRQHWFWQREHHKARYIMYSFVGVVDLLEPDKGPVLTSEDSEHVMVMRLRVLGAMLLCGMASDRDPLADYEKKQKAAQQRRFAQRPPVPALLPANVAGGPLPPAAVAAAVAPSSPLPAQVAIMLPPPPSALAERPEKRRKPN